jgi:hypothetical protein
MGSKRRTEGATTKRAATVQSKSGDGRKRKAATVAADRQVRRKTVINKHEKREPVHHPSHGEASTKSVAALKTATFQKSSLIFSCIYLL